MGFQTPNLMIGGPFPKSKGSCIFSCIKTLLFYKLTFIHEFLLLLSASVIIGLITA